MVTEPSDTEKAKLFATGFDVRQDLVARYWTSKRTGRQGFSPLCRNEWKKGLCLKLERRGCRDCDYFEPKPWSDELRLKHILGKELLCGYPLHSDSTSGFLAVDLDNHEGTKSPLDEVRALAEVCDVQEIPVYVFRSRSGTGYHVYVFFRRRVPAWKARRVAFALLEEAKIVDLNNQQASFDCLFPNQDRATGRGFGNHIALPLQGRLAEQGFTLFLDPRTGFTSLCTDQWSILQNLQKVPEEFLDRIVEDWGLEQGRPATPVDTGAGKDPDERLQRVLDCEFIRWCRAHPSEVPEPLWYAMISNLVRLKGGYSMCHEYSREHHRYSSLETDRKIHQALDFGRPHTCGYIRDRGFRCKRSCGVRSPAALVFKEKKREGGTN